MLSSTLYTSYGLDNINIQENQQTSRLKLNPLANYAKNQIVEKQFSLNPLAKTFILHSASKAISGGCHAVKYSLPYSTEGTKVGVISSYENLGAAPKRGNTSPKLRQTEYNTINNLQEIIISPSRTEKTYDDIMGLKISKNASNINWYNSDRMNALIQVNSNLVQESRELELTYN